MIQEIELTQPIGNIALFADGRIVMAVTEEAERAKPEQERPALQALLRFSEDGGLSWGPAQNAFSYPPGPGVSGWNFPLVSRDGALHIFGLRAYELGGDADRWRSVLLHARSNDGGASWSDLKPIDFGHGYTGALNSAIQMQSGRILLPLSFLDEESERGKFVSTVLFSDDEGDSWHKSNDCRVSSGGTFLESGALEPVVVELNNGLVWMLIRTVTGYFWESFSTDGSTWTPPQPTRIVTSNAPAGLLRLRDGRILLIWNRLYGEPFRGEGISYARYQLHAALSHDDGQTWGAAHVIAERRPNEPEWTHTRYPCAVECPDGKVLVSYQRIIRRPQPTNNPDRELVRFDPALLMA